MFTHDWNNCRHSVCLQSASRFKIWLRSSLRWFTFWTLLNQILNLTQKCMTIEKSASHKCNNKLFWKSKLGICYELILCESNFKVAKGQKWKYVRIWELRHRGGGRLGTQAQRWWEIKCHMSYFGKIQLVKFKIFTLLNSTIYDTAVINNFFKSWTVNFK